MFEVCNKRRGIAFAFDENVLQRRAECIFDCRLVPFGNADDFGKYAHNPAFEHRVAVSVLHQAFNGFLISLIILFYRRVKSELTFRKSEFGVERDNVAFKSFDCFLRLHFGVKRFVVLGCQRTHSLTRFFEFGIVNRKIGFFFREFCFLGIEKCKQVFGALFVYALFGNQRRQVAFQFAEFF